MHFLLRRLKLMLKGPSARCYVCLSSVQEEARGHLEAAGAEADRQARGGEPAVTVPRDALSIGKDVHERASVARDVRHCDEVTEGAEDFLCAFVRVC